MLALRLHVRRHRPRIHATRASSSLLGEACRLRIRTDSFRAAVPGAVLVGPSRGDRSLRHGRVCMHENVAPFPSLLLSVPLAGRSAPYSKWDWLDNWKNASVADVKSELSQPRNRPGAVLSRICKRQTRRQRAACQPHHTVALSVGRPVADRGNRCGRLACRVPAQVWLDLEALPAAHL